MPRRDSQLSNSPRANRNRLRREILKERGLKKIKDKPVRDKAGTHSVSRFVPVESQYDHLKTDRMRLLESRFGLPIDQLLTISPNQSDVARKLGISKGTVTKWKRRLNIK